MNFQKEKVQMNDIKKCILEQASLALIKKTSASRLSLEKSSYRLIQLSCMEESSLKLEKGCQKKGEHYSYKELLQYWLQANQVNSYRDNIIRIKKTKRSRIIKDFYFHIPGNDSD